MHWKANHPLRWKIRLFNPVSCKLSMADAVMLCVLALYLIISALLFSSWVEPSLRGASNWRIGADSITYQNFAESYDDNAVLVSVYENFFGPAMLWLWLKDAWLIALFNISLFLVSLLLLNSVRLWVFLFWILGNLLTFPSLSTLNKEILALFSAVVFWRWLSSRHWSWLCLALISSIFTRWEQIFVILLCVIMLRVKNRRRALIALLFGLSVALYAVGHQSENLDFEIYQSIVTHALNVASAHGLYFMVFPLRLVVALVSQIVQFWVLFDIHRFYDLQTGLFVLSDQLCMCLMLCVLWRQRILKLSNDAVYFLAIFAITYCAIPMNSPRHLYFGYVLGAIVIANAKYCNSADRAAAPTFSHKLAWRKLNQSKTGSRFDPLCWITLRGLPSSLHCCSLRKRKIGSSGS